MKKLILSLFIFCSAFVSAQISIPQVTGLPAALNSKVDKATGKSLIADTLSAKIQPHVTNFSNPHTVTKSQVGLGNVDNTSDINKPISTATQTALDGKQLIGTYATGTGTASGTNTGDETLSSIKTKLGAATAVSDGYLKYQDYALLHTPTTVTASNGLSISGQNISLQNASIAQSGALTFNDWNTFNSKEPAITKNTAFNKNFGTTTGTVLEGRTFGTAANSAVGDFVKINPASVQSGSVWIGGTNRSALQILGTNATATAYLSRWGNGSNEGFLDLNTGGAIVGSSTGYFQLYSSGGQALQLNVDKSATFSSTVNSTGFLLNGNNLTSNLSTNYLPKWNGSSFVNSFISDDGNNTKIQTQYNTPSGLRVGFSPGVGANFLYNNAGNTTTSFTSEYASSSALMNFVMQTAGTPVTALSIYGSGVVSIPATTPSTSPTTGALVVNGGIGADHVRANNFYGNGSNLTGVQLPITLTTNGTSGAATFENGVMNVPNYNVSGGVNQTQTTVSGSTSGNIVGSMPFQTGSYKKVIITLHSLTGTATYTYPVAFSDTGSNIYAHGTAGSSYAVYKDRVVFSGASSSFGCLIIEGY